MNTTRRRFLQSTSLLTASLSLPKAKSHAASTSSVTSPEGETTEPVKVFMIVHGGIKRMRHDRLGVEIDAQTAVATLRFFRKVQVSRIEVPPIVYGRGSPPVPTHPARIIVSAYNRERERWEILRDLAVPPNAAFSGRGLDGSTPMKDMDAHFREAIKQAGLLVIDLGGVELDHVRLECDREHPTWPNHGEANGNIYSVPFGIFNDVSVHGRPLSPNPAVAPYAPVLRHRRIAPTAPAGMEVIQNGRTVTFRGPRLEAGFSLNRPMLTHLGWDDLGEGLAKVNRLLVTRSIMRPYRIIPLCGLTGPLLRTLDHDIGSHLWTGEIDIEGNVVRYLGLRAAENLRLDVAFTVFADHMIVDITEACSRAFTAVEYEAWRFAWDARVTPTGVTGLPSLRPGRNGHVPLPVLLTGEKVGCLALRRVGEVDTTDPCYLQSESYRVSEALTCGLSLDNRSDDGFGIRIPEGTRHATFELRVTNLQPERDNASAQAEFSRGIRRTWATIFSCYRPEYRGFSNNCISTNCHLGQWSHLEVLAHTPNPTSGPDLRAMHRFTTEKALLDGGGYGYWREYFMDSDPALLCAAGTAFRLGAEPQWLERIRPGLVEVFERMTASASPDGLLINERLSGNSGEFTRSTNGIDTVSFGYLDAYSNAWAYRALRNVAPVFRRLGDAARAARAADIADRMHQSYAPTFCNPKTGWVAGWRSKDGKLHDYAYIVINGIAIAFGLLPPDLAHRALASLETLRRQVCPVTPELGLPVNLIPHAFEDHYLPSILQGAQPTYEIFTDGAVSSNLVEYYLRALSLYGFKKEARRLADDFDRGYAEGVFSGGVGSGNEMRSWEGLPTGYEGTLTFNHGLIYAVAVEKGYVKPLDPEWWPA